MSPVSIRRKWSLTGSLEEECLTPTAEETRYLAMSLGEFELAKAETAPDEIVEARNQMLQLNIDQ